MKKYNTLINCIFNLLLAYFCYFVCHLVFIALNWHVVAADAEGLNLWRVARGALLFDTSAISYTHIFYLFLALLPIPARNCNWYQKICKVYYLAVNFAAITVNFADCVYFPFGGRRSTLATITEFQNESAGNLAKIIGIEMLRNWWVVLLALALFAMLLFLYRDTCDIRRRESRSGRVAMRCLAVVAWLSIFPLCIGAMRGGFTRKTRPINTGYAMKFVSTTPQAAAILNTTFATIRNLSHKGYSPVEYMPEEDIAKYYSAIHPACPGTWKGERKPNVMILIVESLAQEYIGAYNNYPCHTPFLDSLHSVSLTFREGFANGDKSVDALPSVLSSIPRMEEHLFMTQYTLNHLNSVVKELKCQGYSSAFFHGGADGTMNFDGYSLSVGVERTYSMSDFCKDRNFGGRSDFDGLWAIWDEEFLQYTALHNDLPEPFITTLFTATSHHPFVIPEKYKERFTLPGHPMHSCIRYTDYALQRFFETASKQSWYDNTIFLITADHTNITEQPEYADSQGKFRIPFIIFDPSGTLPRGVVDRMMQQIDVMPTLLGIIGTPNEYVAFGKDALDPASPDWAITYYEKYQLRLGDSLTFFTGLETESYNPAKDSRELLFLKALVQDYKTRMIEDNLL